MTHDELRELTASYAVGAVSDEERRTVEEHLEICPECRRELVSLRAAAAELAHSVPVRRAPEPLRAKVLAAIDDERQDPAVPPRGPVAPRPAGTAREGVAEPSPARAGAPWSYVAAAGIAAVLIGGYALALRAHISFLDQALRESRAQTAAAERQLLDARGQLQRSEADVRQVRQTTGILAAPDVVRVDLKSPATGAGPVGRAFWSPSHGVLLTANGLPALPGPQVYQLWIVPRGGAPISAGLLQPDTAGAASIVAPATPEPPAAFAVTVEPAGGVPAPTGARVLVGAL